jgi:hypothetical protein
MKRIVNIGMKVRGWIRSKGIIARKRWKRVDKYLRRCGQVIWNHLQLKR